MLTRFKHIPIWMLRKHMPSCRTNSSVTKARPNEPCHDANHSNLARKWQLVPGEDKDEDDEHHKHADHETVASGELHRGKVVRLDVQVLSCREGSPCIAMLRLCTARSET
eukprot:scaffold123421_cov63-Phaeocystis_antarctica.AAC.3